MLDPRVPRWCEKYVGIPWDPDGTTLAGTHCWGLFCIILRVEFTIDVPHYNEITSYSKRDASNIGRLMLGKASQRPWVKIGETEAKAGDGILFEINNRPMHVATVIAPGWVIHIEENMESRPINYDDPWRKPGGIVGVYRHEKLCIV